VYALDGLLETIPDVLVDDVMRKRLRTVGDALPDALCGALFLETRLHEDTRVDLGVLARTRRQLMILAGSDPAIRIPRELRERPSWQGAIRLGRRSLRLADEGSPVLPWHWLEFDTEAEGVPAPGIYTVAVPGTGASQLAGWDTTSVAMDIVATAMGGDHGPADPLRDAVRRVVDGGFLVYQVGLFPGRPGGRVRLVCGGDPDADPAALVEALTRCGWDGARSELASWVGRGIQWGGRVSVHLDVTSHGTAGQVGVDVPCTEAPRPPDGSRRNGFLAELEQARLCTPQKRAALETLTPGYRVDLFTRRQFEVRLFNVKLMIDPSGAVTAKAYITASY
jgi:hypothetical protein